MRASEDVSRIRGSTVHQSSVRRKLIERKGKLRVQTTVRAGLAREGGSAGGVGAAKKPAVVANGAGGKRGIQSNPTPPAAARGEKEGEREPQPTVPGSVDEEPRGEGEGVSGHDRHRSIEPILIPRLSSHPSDPSPAPASTPADPVFPTPGLDEHTLLLASTFLSNASHFRTPFHRYDLLGLRVYRICGHPLTRGALFTLILLNMSLTYLQEKAGLSQSGLLALEFLLLTALTGHTAIELWLFPNRRKQVKSRWSQWELGEWRGVKRRLTIPLWRDKWEQGKVLILSLCFIDLLVAIAGAGSYRAARPCRAYFLAAFSTDTRTQTLQVYSTLQAMLVPFTMVILLVFFEAALAMILFHSDDPSSTYFATLSSSFYAMFAVSTTANYPDITFPAIDAYGLYSSLFFILCLSIGLYVTVSLLIAYTYTHWREQAVTAYVAKLRARDANLTNAFTLLTAGSVDKWKEERARDKAVTKDKDKEKPAAERDKEAAVSGEASTAPEEGGGEGERLLSLTSWTELYSYLHPELAPRERAILSRVFFLLLTTTSTSSCSQQDFLDLCEHLSSLSSLTYKDTLPPKTERALAIQRYFEHRYSQYGRSAVVVLEAVMCIKLFESATSSASLYSPAWPFVLDCLYCVFLCAEVSLSIYINSPQRFLSSPWKRASLTIACISLLGKCLLEFIVQPAVQDRGLTVYRVATAFRLIRVLRVPLVIKRFRLGLKSLVRVFTPLMELFIYLVIIYYVRYTPSPIPRTLVCTAAVLLTLLILSAVSLFLCAQLWAVLGQLIFAGKLDPNNPPPSIVDTSFYTSGYYRFFSFNDFASSLFTLFHLMAITNWHWTVEALQLVTTQSAFLYYLSFYFIVGICTLNLVIAYLVETLEIAVRNLSMQRADKADERRQRREAELWAQEMIDMEGEDPAARRLSSDPAESEEGEGGGVGVGVGVGSTVEGGGEGAGGVRVAPTIEKRKKRVGVFEEDAMKHAERHRGQRVDEEEDSASSMYPGINEELTGEQQAEGQGDAEGRVGEEGRPDAATSSAPPAQVGEIAQSSGGDGGGGVKAEARTSTLAAVPEMGPPPAAVVPAEVASSATAPTPSVDVATASSPSPAQVAVPPFPKSGPIVAKRVASMSGMQARPGGTTIKTQPPVAAAAAATASKGEKAAAK